MARCKFSFLFRTLLINGQSGSSESLHVLAIADPQLLDSNSYPERGPLLTFLSQVFTDMNLRKSFAALRKLEPDHILFLGDMMDGGRADISDAQ